MTDTPATRRPQVLRLEDRQTGEIRYTLDYGQAQLIGPWYETRADAEAARRRRQTIDDEED